MPTTWRKINDTVQEWDESGTKKYVIKYYKDKLEQIFQQAEEWGISPENAAMLKKSKLREITTAALDAINKNERDDLTQLFVLARKSTVSELRNHLRRNRLEEIQVIERNKQGGYVYLMEITFEQFNQITKAMERMFRFTITSEEMDNNQ